MNFNPGLIVARSINADTTNRFRSLRPECDSFLTLPVNRSEYASFSASTSKFSMAGVISPSYLAQSVCKDSIAVFSDGQITLLVLVDAYGNSGAVISEWLPLYLLSCAQNNRDKLTSSRSPKELLIEAVSKMLENIKFDEIGGTTALVTLLFPDNRFHSASIGDSPHYLLQAEELSRQFTHNLVWSYEDGFCTSMQVQGMLLDQYKKLRSRLGPSITDEDVDPQNIEEFSGTLNRGDLLILGTDGFSKNLHLSIDVSTSPDLILQAKIKDVSGITDLKRIIGPMRNPEQVVSTVLRHIDKRKFLDSNPTLVHGVKVTTDGNILIPDNDDVTLLAVRRI